MVAKAAGGCAIYVFLLYVFLLYVFLLYVFLLYTFSPKNVVGVQKGLAPLL